ncbi:hypothetical protein QJS04_geneDACA015221 [Acorus gramineus]|uniref:Uncharacterized protein n=1 Tax=Acorus gramineus TaxID=55184 RepID=A0AAV9B877_ACOGR|nr:hypothetical protein QJS04_geneDACA015221 [Acorus gramineus]
MELSSIRDAFDHVSKKRNLSSSNTQEMIDGIIREIENALVKMKTPLDEEGSSINGKSILSELSIKLKEMSPVNQFKQSKKEMDLALHKYAKLLENKFNPDISTVYIDIDFDTRTLN